MTHLHLKPANGKIKRAEFSLYDSFNEAVNAYFFDGRHAHTPVYLDLEATVQQELSEKLGWAAERVEKLAGEAVASTLVFRSGDPYARHLLWLEQWERIGRQEPPPFTGLLCVLSLAAEKMRADGQFSSNNYYQRLIEVLGFDTAGIRPKLTIHARSTRRFWRALNLWLTERDFELGRPTARQVNSWKYVSYAISQALVRDGDRRNFHQLFHGLGLSADDDVSDGEMALYIHEWMATAGPSGWLKKIWSVNDLRERVIAAALAELDTWDEGGRTSIGEAAAPRGRLSWIAAISGFPRKRCTLWLCAPARESRTIGGLQLSAPHSAAAQEAFSGCHGDLVLSPLGIGEILALGPAGLIGIGPLMHASFELEAKGSTHRFVHTPKPVIPLAKSESGPFYREVARVSLLKEHLVLCHENWANDVNQFLKSHAAPGFTLVGSDELPGIPKGWSLFRDVVVASSPTKVNDNLAALAPIAGGVSIQFSGGLRLSPGIWHPEAPPKVAAVLEEADFKLLILREGLDNEAEQISVSSKKNAVSLDLDGLAEREGGNFRAVVSQGINEKAEKPISFRSAETPRPPSSKMFGYHVSDTDPQWAISAMSFDDSGDKILRGLQLPVELPTAVADEPVSCHDPVRYAEARGSDMDDEALPEFKPGAFEAPVESCVIRSYHYWIVEPFNKGDNRYEAKRMNCKDCGISTMTQSRARVKSKPSKKTLQVFDAAGRKISSPWREALEEVSPDLVLDALCYLGRGSWATFQSVATTHRNEPWYPASLARLLAELGHVDLEFDRASMRPKRWQVAPPTLVENAEGGIWFLAGFRSRGLVDAVTEALEAIDCEPVNPQPDETLSAHAWHCESAGAVARALTGIVDPLGRQVAIVSGAAERLAAALPDLSELREQLPSVHMESPPDLQVFDLRSGKWRDTKDSDAPGAYRSSYGACRYFHRGADGSARAGTAELVKVMAASDERVALHSHDEETGTFSAVLGCEPPGLFARALVACSGQEPRRNKGRVLFTGVPPRVGRIILSRLYGHN